MGAGTEGISSVLSFLTELIDTNISMKQHRLCSRRANSARCLKGDLGKITQSISQYQQQGSYSLLCTGRRYCRLQQQRKVQEWRWRISLLQCLAQEDT